MIVNEIPDSAQLAGPTLSSHPFHAMQRLGHVPPVWCIAVQMRCGYGFPVDCSRSSIKTTLQRLFWLFLSFN